MNLQEMGEDLWRELHELHSITRIVRATMAVREETCCADSDHRLYFTITKESFLQSLIMGVGRLLDDKKGVLSMKKWLHQAIKSKPQAMEMTKIIEAKKQLNALAASEEGQLILDIRHNSYAHTNPKWNAESVLSQVTWKQLFDLHKNLQDIFNLAASAGLSRASPFTQDTIHITGYGSSNIEKDMVNMLMAIERDCHTDENHKWQLERGSMPEDTED